jgi:two-component system CheB/CheR fusion protein
MPSKKSSPRHAPGAACAAGPSGPAPAKVPPAKGQADRKPAPGPAGTEPDTAPRKTLRPVPPFSIVGIGASAGGLEALEELFHPMPLDTGLAFVVVTHQHPGHISMLAELLGRITRLSVVEAADGMKVKPNHIYTSPPGGYLAILGGTLHRMETGQAAAPHLPIDYFFRSLAEDQKDRAIAVILSGTGTDGTAGLQAIKNESGIVMAQEAASAKFAGMPESAIASGLVDHVLPPAGIVRQLVAGPRAGTGGDGHPEHPGEAAESFAGPMGKMLVLLRSRTGHDFSAYKTSTIRRRIERRMNLNGITRPKDYVRYLEENPHEADLLFKELLISVTGFFRDPEAFEVLGRTVLPEWLQTRPDSGKLRIWVPGCASGEEAYSLAMLMSELTSAEQRHRKVQIFATDLDGDAINAARRGHYPGGIAANVSPRRLERFFTSEDGGWRIRKNIREMVVFAVQNVIKDPPFTKLDFISCRNVMIYLNAELQRRLLPIFHYALKPGGLLFLGPSETISGAADLFEAVDRKWKIYRRREPALPSHPVLGLTAAPERPAPDSRPDAVAAPSRDIGVAGAVERLLLTRFTPASVVVNDRGDVAYIHGRTGNYLEPAAGQPRLNVLAMAREGLDLELAAALRQAVAGTATVAREGIRVRTNGNFSLVDISIFRLDEPAPVRGLWMITFRSRGAPPVETGKVSRARKAGERELNRIKELEHELLCTRETLQTTIEELETANEELKSANEEQQSTNEELQSTIEELETSKEEMQSLNEELTTVNTELQAKVDDMLRANDDMQNLLNSTEIATVFLDGSLKIKRYTDQATWLINLIQTDIGRPVSDLVSSLTYDLLTADCREVLRTLVFKQAEVRTKDGHWYLMRIMPYRTAENVIDGLVLTFVDINPVKEAEKSLLRMSKVFLDGPEPMIIVDLSGRIIDLNREAARVYGWSRQEMLGHSFKMTLPESDGGQLDDLLRRCLAGGTARATGCTLISKAGATWKGGLTLLLLTDEEGKPEAVCMLAENHQPER